VNWMVETCSDSCKAMNRLESAGQGDCTTGSRLFLYFFPGTGTPGILQVPVQMRDPGTGMHDCVDCPGGWANLSRVSIAPSSCPRQENDEVAGRMQVDLFGHMV